MENKDYKISRRSDNRFIICDASSNKVLEDAQGYGYTTRQKAEKAAWYKFKGGKHKLDSAKKEAVTFWNKNKEFKKSVNDFYEGWFKEIGRGEVDVNEEVIRLVLEMRIDGFKLVYLNYL